MVSQPAALAFASALSRFFDSHLNGAFVYDELASKPPRFTHADTLSVNTEPLPRIFVAYSGGLDSSVLLHLAAHYLPIDSITAVHVHHGLQAEADQWLHFCEQQAKALGVTFVGEQVACSTASEEAARRARYQVFERLLGPADVLLMGHHLNDQAETLMFRWLRAAGPQGLTGIPAQRPLAKGQLLRPLLQVSGASLEEYANAHKLEWIDDPSNLQSHYDRNYLRHEVLPAIEKRWPDYAQQWASSAELVAASQVSHHYFLDQQLKGCTDSIDGHFRLSTKGWGALPQSVQQSLLYRWLERAQCGVSHAQLLEIQRAVLQAEADRQPEVRLGAHLLRRHKHWLYLTVLPLAAPQNLAVITPGRHFLGDGWLTVSPSPTGVGLRLDASLSLLRRQGGETLLDEQGRNKKIKKSLQKLNLPAWVRDNWPVINQDEITVAVPGVGIASPWCVQKGGFQVSWQSSSLSDGECFAIL
ncbi:MAG: tRNA lysidine(34) synthetase TilS [Pontibacterium sp.]